MNTILFDLDGTLLPMDVDLFTKIYFQEMGIMFKDLIVPKDCMMVGNDVQEDLVAGELGMKTFLIRDNIIHRTDEQVYANYIGYYDDFLNFAKNLPVIN